ncbi:pyrimidine dimer DNA glycosylase/endonuclease V [Citricoccus muralis]|uniref:Pyrimidine dimer DNA glycosylase/endonuclease V n=1 Tax=Citricoccus muralis TaxID=169134 RepID=A0ABY8H4H3_9MICC|nr:pyrimidine dimer DNA glycosylase/endonuclease V [Citricoccus muralis]WFP15552.1 pyrimidine dimer DNA glycosylase/endonuclease V [Citricoccus muralis]
MRLWSLHPEVLDRQGLIAGWREALLAQAVLLGRTRGYTRHPQLERFRSHPDPGTAIGAYLSELHADATRRGYRFDVGRIAFPLGPDRDASWRMEVTTGQLAFEWDHLQRKLRQRSPDHVRPRPASIPAHPMFVVVDGPIATWERP